MGSLIEINDTLKLTYQQGMPLSPEMDKEYNFCIKDRRLYHMAPVRVFLVNNINGKWKYIGHCIIISQTIDAILNTTSGKFKVTKIYDGEYAKLATINEAPSGKSFY